MPDLTLSTKTLIEVHPVLAAVEQLTPPMTAKGRYALAKATAKTGPAYELYSKQAIDLMKKVATRDEKDMPILKQTDAGITFNVRPECQEEYAKESAALLEEEVVLSGCRAITHAELGNCPITGQQERVLIAAGLLVDEEPA